ncbi:N-acetylglucosamine-6-phosphate deacetylase [Croceicoccus marinus]|uniref:N-acetylglucosamine-6-phosphate deacetylase n=1 Tax=Croceicoccus marinus TaxID=450378 RepID=A0A7G6VZI1_9SPHN|nr:N-acetylglucosamine-6-phosphate deacetylase [Croceicoccus marinus]QNE07146.1 N-acetylglucosamine-6-phosphate deacetylase [Croceicoccus marinus]
MSETNVRALVNARIVLPETVEQDRVLIVRGPLIEAIVDRGDLDPAIPVEDLGGGYLLPGFIDSQVNGGGGVLLNDSPTLEAIETIARSHAAFGTTGMLPTLISDTHAIIGATFNAVSQAVDQNVPGVLGCHVEGPYLNPGRAGIHDVSRITEMTETAFDQLTVSGSGIRLVTLAPEMLAPGTIARLAAKGIIISAGHSLAGYDETVAAIDEGLTGFTHLFNAMTQLGSREPGMVGAALDQRGTFFGLIVDGAHVHPASIRIALAARGLDGAMLVTDAMPVAGQSNGQFTLMGKTVEVADGVCRDAQGTLAGSALTMDMAFRNAIAMLGLSICEASQLASGNPARFLRLEDKTGTIAPGLRADLVHMDNDLALKGVWIGGELQG